MRRNSIQVTIYWISAPSRSNLTPIQVSSCASHLHTCPISPSSRFLNSCVTSIQVAYYLHPGCSIQVPIFASHLHPGGVPYPPSSENGISTPCRSHLTPIHNVSRRVFHLHPGPISIASRSQDLGLNSIQVAGHLHPGRRNCIPASCNTHLTSFLTFTPSPRYHITAITVPRFGSHLQPGPMNWISNFTPSMILDWDRFRFRYFYSI